jgi:heat-inducible transcriptional repressor
LCGEPVGSRTISKILGRSYSPATIRNIMQDFEDMGLVRQPHTSAGRVPTVSALKFYISQMMNPKILTDEERRSIESLFFGDVSDILQVLDGLGKILATLSTELALIISPTGEEIVLHRIELIPMTTNRIVMVLVTKAGLTRTIMLEVPEFSAVTIEKLQDDLNRRLSGYKFSTIIDSIAERLSDLEKLYGSFTTKLVLSAGEIFKIEGNVAAIFGRENILKKPEFADPEVLRQVMELSEKNEALVRYVPQNVEESGEIIIGEPPNTRLGLVVASYPHGSGKGIIGLIGPVRMNYPKLIELVTFAASEMSKYWKK